MNVVTVSLLHAQLITNVLQALREHPDNDLPPC